MTGRRKRDEVESRLDEVRRLLRQRHAGIEPDGHFADRVMARLPRDRTWSIAWAAVRILPVSIAFAVALMIVVVTTTRSPSPTTTSATVGASQTAADPLEWLLESRGEDR